MCVIWSLQKRPTLEMTLSNVFFEWAFILYFPRNNKPPMLRCNIAYLQRYSELCGMCRSLLLHQVVLEPPITIIQHADGVLGQWRSFPLALPPLLLALCDALFTRHQQLLFLALALSTFACEFILACLVEAGLFDVVEGQNGHLQLGTWKQEGRKFNSLAPGRCSCNLKLLIFKPMSRIDIFISSCEIALRWMAQDHSDDWSTLVQIMAEPMLIPIYVAIWCHQAKS